MKHRCYVLDYGDGWCFCGKVEQGLAGVFGLMEAELEQGDTPLLDEVLVQIKIVEMTDEEIAAIPEV